MSEVFYIATLGERIRTYRKKKKMTLEALAGDGMTKGMLSLIENNKANPSMDSLRFIAERLGVDITDLLEEVSSQELRDILEEAEQLYQTATEMQPNAGSRFKRLVQPYIDKLSQGYESARLLELYGKYLFFEGQDAWPPYIDQAAQIYEQMNLTSKRADIGLFRAISRYREQDYQEGLQILLQERAHLEEKYARIEPMTQLDFHYYEAAFYFAVGDYDQAKKVMEAAIDYSKEQRIFYRIEDLYRLAAAHAMMSGDLEKQQYYRRKLLLYGEFADDEHSLLFCRLMDAEAAIINGQYDQALEMVEAYFKNPTMKELIYPYFLIAKGKTFYGLACYQDAIQTFEQVVIPDYLYHPFDLSMFYVKEAYLALCYLQLGQEDLAFELASEAMENIGPFPQTPQQDFVKKTYHMLKEKLDK